MNEEQKYIYAKPVIDFVGSATSFCISLESNDAINKQIFIDKFRGILPLLYIKMLLLKELESQEEVLLETIVTEEDYNIVLHKVKHILGESDEYLDVFQADMRYSDQPICKTISEDLADLYQVLRNFVEIYRGGNEEAMYEALTQLIDDFKLYWGQTLLNCLKALHDVRFHQEVSEEEF